MSLCVDMIQQAILRKFANVGSNFFVAQCWFLCMWARLGESCKAGRQENSCCIVSSSLATVENSDYNILLEPLSVWMVYQYTA